MSLFEKNRSYGKIDYLTREKVLDIINKDSSLSKNEYLQKIQESLTDKTQFGYDIKSEYLFHQNFPYSAKVENISKDTFSRIALNSVGKNITFKHKSSSKKMKLFIIILIVVGISLIIGIIIKTSLDKSIMSIDSAPEEEIESRQKARGLLASLITALLFSFFINTAIDATGKVSSATSTALIGMTLGGSIGFLLDNAIGSERGYAKTKHSIALGARSAFASMFTPRYGRYVVTILFDMFFTVILFKPIFLQLLKLPFLGEFDLGVSIANGLTSTIIGIITFYCYANLTRFQWAYPSSKTSGNSLIKGNQIVLVVSVMAIVYLISNTQLFPGESGINDPRVKIFVTMGAMTIIGVLLSNGIIDEKNIKKQDSEENDPTIEESPNKWKLGFALFVIIVITTVFITYSTSLHESWKQKWIVPLGITLLIIIISLITCYIGKTEIHPEKNTDANTEANTDANAEANTETNTEANAPKKTKK